MYVTLAQPSSREFPGKTERLSARATISITLLRFSSIFQPRKCNNFKTTGFSVCTLIIGVCGDHNIANKFHCETNIFMNNILVFDLNNTLLRVYE